MSNYVLKNRKAHAYYILLLFMLVCHDYIILQLSMNSRISGLFTDAFQKREKKRTSFHRFEPAKLATVLYMTAESLRLSLLHRRETGRPSTVARRKSGKGRKRSGS